MATRPTPEVQSASVLDESLARVVQRLGSWPEVWVGLATDGDKRRSPFARLDLVVLHGGQPALRPNHLVARPDHDDDMRVVEITAPGAEARLRALLGARDELLGIKVGDKPGGLLERRARLAAGEHLGACEWLADWVSALDLPSAEALLAPPAGAGHGRAARPRRVRPARGRIA